MLSSDNSPPPTYEDVVNSSANAYPTLSPHFSRETSAAGLKGNSPKRLFNVVLSDPVRQDDTIADFTVFRVTTRTTHPTYSEEFGSMAVCVSRRYSDFEWLYETLRMKFPGIILPILPDKTDDTFGPSDKFDIAFVLKRMAALTFFINKVTAHTTLQPGEDLRLFLTEKSAEVWADRSPWYETGIMASVSSWFNSLGVSAEGAYYNKGKNTLMEAEDPEYLEVVDYFMGLEGRLETMRDHVSRLARSSHAMSNLWGEFGHTACAVGAAEADGSASLKLERNESMDESFSKVGNATASLATQDAKVDEMMHTLLEAIKYYLKLLEEIKKTFEVRADALLQYQSACSKYNERASTFTGSVVSQANADRPVPSSEAVAGEMSVAGAAAHRDECKRRYDTICRRMKSELGRVYVEQTEDLNAALHQFVAMQAAHATFTAHAWDKVMPGCGKIGLMAGVAAVREGDKSLATDELSSMMHKGLNAMGITKDPIALMRK